jgi:ribonuclease Y
MPQVPVLVLVLASVVCFGAGWLGHRVRIARLHAQARDIREHLLAEANKDAEELRKNAKLEAREEVLQARQRFETETEKSRHEHARRQEALDQREIALTQKTGFLDKKEARLGEAEEDLKRERTVVTTRQQEAEDLRLEQARKLEAIAGMSADGARDMLIAQMVDSARRAAAKQVLQIREDLERTAKRDAQKIISLAVQRYASEHVAEETVSVVDLPNEDMKGRIIGREGRNIRAFEVATGVDVIIDDTPEAVIISAFDPVRREVAQLSLRRLIKDGRIHPGRIEEVVLKTQQEMQERLRELGEQACLAVGLQNLHPDLAPIIGRLHYRTSYGQNLLIHSREVAGVAGVIASELGLDPQLARRCAFLHDIGKAVDHEVDGPHAEIGGRILRKYGESDIVLNAVEGHHNDCEPISPYTFITAAADAASASRPGARRESIESYVKRLENLERIAESFAGVEKSYAIQAGREIRILVDHTQVSDAEAALLAEEISRRVEDELQYPGQIKIMVIRETRAVSVAK